MHSARASKNFPAIDTNDQPEEEKWRQEQYSRVPTQHGVLNRHLLFRSYLDYDVFILSPFLPNLLFFAHIK
jgi:hypothetical protein